MKLWYEKGAWASKKAKNIAGTISPDAVRSIAVIRHAAIGDMMVLRPFLLQARVFFPNAEITLSIINTYSYGVPSDLVDRVHSIDKKINGKKTSYAARLKQIRELGEHDLIFDMANTGLSAMICLLNSAKLKIGFPYRSFKNYLFYDIGLLRSDLVPEVETLLHMLYIIGAPKSTTLNYGYPTYTTKTDRPYIIYFTSASLGWKWWPKEHFVELIKSMALQYPHMDHVVLEGINPEENVDDLMMQLSSFTNVVKREALALDLIIPFLGEATLVVSGDTGIRNMAIAAETATVGIFFFTVPYRYLPINTKHQAVFNPDGSVPDVKSVFSAIKYYAEQ
jgi:ADP-heptose:LPS heptosyltransferase